MQERRRIINESVTNPVLLRQNSSGFVVFCGGVGCSLPQVTPPVGDGVPQWSAAEQMPLGYDVPSARRCRAGNGLPRRFAPRNDKVRRRAGPACPAEINAYPAAGHMGPALQGHILASRRADRVVRPYAPCHCEEYPKGTCFAARSDAAIRSQRGTAALTGRRTPRAFVPLRSTAGRRPLHTASLRGVPQGHLLRGAKRRGNPFSPAQRNGFPRR